MPLRFDATIERRLLINYRVDPTVARSLLPAHLRPQLIDGSAVAGICLLRLGAMRPRGFGPQIGWGAENAAHRIAVEWDDGEVDAAVRTRVGVYVPERHSASWLAVAAGGRVFPGRHSHARFRVSETSTRFVVELDSKHTRVAADVQIASQLNSRLFPTLDAASSFFRAGSLGWSPARGGGALQGLRLDTDAWQVEPGMVGSIHSSFFDALPPGSAELDSALVMRTVPITWSTDVGPAPTYPQKTPSTC